MRIHTNTLTREDLAAAAARAGVGFFRLETRGSRSRAHAFDVILQGTGRTRGNSGTRGAGDYTAATWDEWGIFLGELFRRDPGATVPRVYVDGEHFRWSTGARYDTLTPAGQHKRHRWSFHGVSVGGAYIMHGCQSDECDAIMRRPAHGRTWEEIGGAA